LAELKRKRICTYIEKPDGTVIKEEKEEMYFKSPILEQLDLQILEQLLGDFIIQQLKEQTRELFKSKIELYEKHGDLSGNEHGTVYLYDIKVRVCNMMRSFIKDNLGVLAVNSAIETIMVILQELIEAAVKLYIANKAEHRPLH